MVMRIAVFAFARLRDAEVVEKFVFAIWVRASRPSGWLYADLRMLPRAGDSAPMALMQLVDGPAGRD